MKLQSADIKRLKWAIILVVTLSSIGGGTVFGTHWLHKDTDRKYIAATAARKDIESRLTRARDEELELREKIGRYQNLAAQGLIGTEMRLDWVEAIDRVKATRRIFRLEYEFAPQRLVDATILPGGATAGGFEFMSSQLRLNMDMLHEGDLFNFIADLRKEVRAIIQVRACAIERIGAEDSQRSNSAQLKADCTLEWITLKEKK
jgi:hypothetical protein